MVKSNFELLALSKLLREQDQQLFLELHPELFTGQYQQLFKIVQKSFSDNHKLPSLTVLEALVNSKAPASLRPTLNGILQAMHSADLENIETPTIAKGLRDKQLLATIDENVTALNQCALHRDTEGVRQVLSKIVEDINLDSVKPADFMEAMDLPDQAKILPSGIDELDEFIGGVGGLTIISGSSGGGKSIALLQMAVGQYLKGYNILYVSLELTAQTLGNRMKSLVTGIPFAKINKGDLSTDDSNLIAERMAQFKAMENNFRIVTDPLDTEELLNTIKVEKSLYGIDAVYIDYLNLVMAPKSANSGWMALADTAKALHRLSHQLGVVTISASQVNVAKKPQGTKPPELETRGSRELEFSATLWMHLYSMEENAEDGSATDAIVLYIMKNRNAQRTALMFEKKFSTMQIEFICEV